MVNETTAPKAFKPAIDINAIITAIKPIIKERKAKVEGASGEKTASTLVSVLSGFPSIHAIHEYVLASNPAVAFNQMEVIMDKEFPYAVIDENGKKVAADFKGETFKVRTDAKGELMKTANGELVTRAYKAAHFTYYKKDILGGKNWTIGEDFGVTAAMKTAAEATYVPTVRKAKLPTAPAAK
jgi:hypothetical protein